MHIHIYRHQFWMCFSQRYRFDFKGIDPLLSFSPTKSCGHDSEPWRYPLIGKGCFAKVYAWTRYIYIFMIIVLFLYYIVCTY